MIANNYVEYRSVMRYQNNNGKCYIRYESGDMHKLSQFRCDENTTYLWIDGYPHDTFDGNILKNLGNLTRLQISSAVELKELDENVFINNPLLENITISSCNNLSSLPENIFERLTRLNSLTLLRNGLSGKIPRLPSSLITLSMLFNEGPIEVPCDIFKNTPSITSIALIGNDISMIDVNCFSDLSNLELLELRDNPFLDEKGMRPYIYKEDVKVDYVIPPIPDYLKSNPDDSITLQKIDYGTECRKCTSRDPHYYTKENWDVWLKESFKSKDYKFCEYCRMENMDPRTFIIYESESGVLELLFDSLK